MTTISMPIHITVQEAEFLTSGELYALYLIAVKREEQAKQKSIALAVQRMRLADKTVKLFGYETAARVVHLA